MKLFKYHLFLFYCFYEIINVDALASNSYEYLTPPQIIRARGYPAETHTVQSEDGYLIGVHRIPHGKNKQNSKRPVPLLLHHGFMSNSIDWVFNEPDKSLGYKFADEGYDVWLPNLRGNRFSRRNIKYSPFQPQFWNFTFHESGYYDLPAVIDYILNQTNHEQLVYIGHSLGNTIFYVMASTRPEYNKKIKAQVGLAPFVTGSHVTSAFRLITILVLLKGVPILYGLPIFFSNGILSDLLLFILCGPLYFDRNLCYTVAISKLFGADPKGLNETLIPIFANNFPSGTSLKTTIHAVQLLLTGKKYVFQEKDNRKIICISKDIELRNSMEFSTKTSYDVTESLKLDCSSVHKTFFKLYDSAYFQTNKTDNLDIFNCRLIINTETRLFTDRFQQYDYGLIGNLEKYHSIKPPKYDISKITVPIRLYYGQNDILADPVDVKLFYSKIPNPMGLVKINYDKFTHINFLFVRDVNRLVNNELITFIRNITDPHTGSKFIQQLVEIAKKNQ